MVVYCNDERYAKKFIVPGTEDKKKADVEVYVLTADMTPLELMKAFKACRVNPMKAWYFISPDNPEFYEYACDAIHRGTVNIYSDWGLLESALTDDILQTTEKQIHSCVSVSFDNFGIIADDELINFITGAVMQATSRYGAYPAAKAFLRLLESGHKPNVPLYNTIMKALITTSAGVEDAVNEFRKSGSSILGVLATERIYKLTLSKQEEFDRVAAHVMFMPFTPDMHDLKDRCGQIVRVAKENGK